jgi:uncharacterized OB-fold protein
MFRRKREWDYLCPECGALVAPDDRFCATCGIEFDVETDEPLRTERRVFRCPECGESVTSLQGFCSVCGADLRERENPGRGGGCGIPLWGLVLASVALGTIVLFI